MSSGAKSCTTKPCTIASSRYLEIFDHFASDVQLTQAKMQFSLLLSLALSAVCLVETSPITSSDIARNTAKGLRLISFAEEGEPVWKAEADIFAYIKSGIHFFDVSEVYEPEQKWSNVSAKAKAGTISCASRDFPFDCAYTNSCDYSAENMQSDLATLTAYNNRYYKSMTGAAASTWIKDKITSYIVMYGRSDVTVSLFTHNWAQSSVIAKIHGTNSSGAVIIVGAHMDSINLKSPTNGRAPGADDDGTGTVNVIEAFRVLLAADFRPTEPVEFHWYSAEEVGLLGSQAIATEYRSSGVNVKAFMELDMSGYFKPGTKEVVAIQADYINTELNAFLKALITQYSRIPWAMDAPCGYACSDHASWHKAGFPSAFPYEAITGNDNPNVHTSSDTTNVIGFSWAHSLEFAKIGVAFVYELAI
ncbi:aminopeptidase [Flammula alnicola]|nr:aminopeptidase [Flammula alnicola]